MQLRASCICSSSSNRSSSCSCGVCCTQQARNLLLCVGLLLLKLPHGGSSGCPALLSPKPWVAT